MRCRLRGLRSGVSPVWLTFVTLAGLFVIAAARQESAGAALLAAAFGAVFLALALRDLESRVIPNRIVYPSLVLAIALAPTWPGHGTLGALGGALAGAAPLAGIAMITPSGMGAGDVKMAALVGAVVGYPAALFAVAVAGLAGGVAAVALLLAGVPQRAAIPYAPFLAVGCAVTLLQR